MKVRELIAQLERHDLELEVVCYSEDEDLLSGGRGFRLFDISAVDETDARRMRLPDQTPYLKFERNAESQRHVLLEITADF